MGLFDEWRWRRRLKHLESLHSGGGLVAESLRLVLGPGRSGTSWLSGVLAASSTPMRFFKEPLNGLRPALDFAPRFDRTALAFSASPSERERLLWSYRSLTETGDFWRSGAVREPLRSDDDWQVCLVKEVHALLAIEELIRGLGVPAVVITRDPVYVVDSLLSFRGLDAPIWVNEYEALDDSGLLERIGADAGRVVEHRKRLAGTSERERVMTSKALTVAALNALLGAVAADQTLVHLVRYEDLCADPVERFRDAAEHLGLEVGAEMHALLTATQENDRADDPYSIYRDTEQQVRRDLRFVTADEEVAVRGLLAECGLD